MARSTISMQKPMLRQPQGGMSGANFGGMVRGGGPNPGGSFAVQRQPIPGKGLPSAGGGMAGSQMGGIDGAIRNQMQSFLTGGMQKPAGSAIPPQRLQAMNAKPAWQQLKEMGLQGQGDPAANRALLAQQTGGPSGAASVSSSSGGAGAPPQQQTLQRGFPPPMPEGGGGLQPQQQAFNPRMQAMAMRAAGGGGLDQSTLQVDPDQQVTSQQQLGVPGPDIHQQLLRRSFAGQGM